MGRTKGTLICPKCRTANPNWHSRMVNGCRRCYYRFPEDKKALQLHKEQQEVNYNIERKVAYLYNSK